jgi:hypothetical protein
VIATLAWIAAGFGFVAIVVWALCRASAHGDRDLLAPHPDEQPDWSQVAHLDYERRRRRSDVRNGLHEREDALNRWDALTRDDSHLASWAHATVIEPVSERALGALADWATEVVEPAEAEA